MENEVDQKEEEINVEEWAGEKNLHVCIEKWRRLLVHMQLPVQATKSICFPQK